MFTCPGGFDPSAYPEPSSSTYRSHLQHLKLKGLQPKTIDAYARTIRRIGDYFGHQIDNLSPAQLTEQVASGLGLGKQGLGRSLVLFPAGCIGFGGRF